MTISGSEDGRSGAFKVCPTRRVGINSHMSYDVVLSNRGLRISVNEFTFEVSVVCDKVNFRQDISSMS